MRSPFTELLLHHVLRRTLALCGVRDTPPFVGRPRPSERKSMTSVIIKSFHPVCLRPLALAECSGSLSPCVPSTITGALQSPATSAPGGRPRGVRCQAKGRAGRRAPRRILEPLFCTIVSCALRCFHFPLAFANSNDLALMSLLPASKSMCTLCAASKCWTSPDADLYVLEQAQRQNLAPGSSEQKFGNSERIPSTCSFVNEPTDVEELSAAARAGTAS